MDESTSCPSSPGSLEVRYCSVNVKGLVLLHNNTKNCIFWPYFSVENVFFLIWGSDGCSKFAQSMESYHCISNNIIPENLATYALIWQYSRYFKLSSTFPTYLKVQDNFKND